ncbi:TPA: hypothetical protein ACF5HI_004106 [Salmonella enterica]
MIHTFKPEGEKREWKAVSMNLKLDAEINYLLEKEGWSRGLSKQKIILAIVDQALKDRELTKKFLDSEKTK